LDMVGAPDATFYYDGTSQKNASRIMTETWEIAHQLGYQKYFVKDMGFVGIIDDHVYVNQNAGIPMIDILDYRGNTKDFGPYHHTSKDNMSVISKETLAAVADVVLTVLYNE
ncbi:MAG TPA: M28 family peptidase, partial [Roseivirga sp.]